VKLGPPDPVAVALAATKDKDKSLPELLKLFEAAFPLVRTTNSDFLHSFALLLHQTNGKHTAQVVALLEQAVALSPLDANLWAELGAGYAYFARFDDALRCCDESLRLNPNQSTARWNRSLELLARGEWEEGWKDYRYGQVLGKRPVRSPEAEWNGENIGNRTLYLSCEQGIGDMIQMLRFVADARVLAGPDAKIIVEVYPDLLPIFGSKDLVPGATQVVAVHPSYAFQCGEKDPVHASLMSLPRILKVTPDNLKPFPYAPHFTARDEIRNSLPVRVGLVWKGSKAHADDSKRSLSDEDILNLIQPMDDRFQFVNLQYGYDASVSFRNGSGPIDIEKPTITTFYETAEVIKTLDIVVGVDTSVCHLAGAMACPVFLMLAATPDWRWGREGEKTPWYANHYLFRQKELGDWPSVISRVRQTLINFADARSVK